MNRGTLKNKIVRRSARFCFPLLYEKIIRNSISATEYISRIELIWTISHAQKDITKRILMWTEGGRYLTYIYLQNKS